MPDDPALRRVGSVTPEATGIGDVGGALPSGNTPAPAGNEGNWWMRMLRRSAPRIPVVQPTDTWQSDDLAFSC